MNRSIPLRGVALVTLAQFLVLSCGTKTAPTTPAGSGSSGSAATGPTGGRGPLMQEPAPGLTMRLSDGRQGPSAVDHSALAKATPLSDADTTALLARVPAVKADPGDTVGFALRDRSTPPPRTGTTIKGSFPPPPAGPPPSVAAADLQLLRWAPEGDVPIAPSLQLTFSQPMIAVTSQDDAAKVVPVKLSPTPAGRWRWLGTRTITFDPEVRFPQATTYTVEVPAGTRSATGAALADGKSFTFTTPTPRVQQSWPLGSPQRLDAPMFILFDQKIDPAAVLATIKVQAAGKDTALRLLTADEIAKHETLKELVDSAKANQQDGRWLAFRATTEFPTATHVTVTVGPGTPSAEGPNRTKDAQSFAFDTYEPLRITEAQCGWGDCRPGVPFQLQFNNPLDEDRWDDALVTITPDVGAARVTASGGYVTVQGATKAMTKYELRISGGVVDTFGQTLGKDATYTFKVGPSYPNFYGPSGLVALDPAGKQPTLDVFSSNYDGIKVALYKVTPADWQAFTYYLQHQWERTKPRVPGTKVLDTIVPVKGAKEELSETKLPLDAALASGGLGHVIAIVEPSPWRESYDPPRLITWVQSTRIGLDAAVDGEDMYAWVNKLADGAPIGEAALELQPYGTKAVTAADGTATIALSAGKKGANILVARAGADTAFLPDDYGFYGDGEGQWVRRANADGLVWYVTDDRQMYRPGEDVHLKGWMRVRQGRKGGDIAGLAGAVTGVRYKVNDPLGNEITSGTATVTPLGGFDLAFKLPKTPNLGYASVQLEADGRIGGSAYHSFQIQEFRRPEYEVSTQVSQGPQMIGDSADVTVNARYFAGGGLQDADVHWNLTANETTFTPPNRDDFTFGVWVPWWGWGRRWWDEDSMRGKPPQSWNHDAKTDATGAHVLHLDFVSVSPPGPMSVTASATVVDVNRQGWSSSSTILVHPSSVYVGLRTPKPFVDKGTPIELEAIAVDLDGKAVPGRTLDIRMVRLDWKYAKGKYTEIEADPQSCAPVSAADPVKCSFDTPNGGQYRITAIVDDAQGRKNRTELTVWVSGGETPPMREVAQEQVQLIPDAKEYAPGQTAELLVQAPFYPAEGVLSTRRSGVVSSTRFTMTGPTYTVKVPITDGYTPNLYVQVDLVGAATRVDDQGKPDTSLPKRPAYATGTLELSIPPRQRTLSVAVTPRTAKVSPGEKTRLDVAVKDAAGRPVADAEVAVLAVDEAVLALSGYQFPDPVALFYASREAGASDHHLRGFVKLAQPAADQLAENTRGRGRDGVVMLAGAIAPEEGAMAGERFEAPMAPPPPPAPPGGAKDKAMKLDGDTAGAATTAGPAIAVRSNFDPLAVFAPAVRSGADGKAAVELTVPDNLTRYRLVAIAVAGEKQFGKGESAMTARLPLMVRPSAPRFLNFGDTFQLPVVLQNQTDAPLDVSVAVRATNAALTAGGGRRVTVPANDRVEVRFPAAAELAGTARFQLVATSKAGGDAAEVALPVWTPATTEAFATYGQIDAGAIRQPVALPGKVVTDFGGLEVETSSTQLQALTDAFLYLVAYPFECAEQRASRIAAIAALRDVLSAFKAKGLPPAAALEARVGEDLERLYAMQNGDGGFPFWQRGYESWPFLTVHVTNAMLRAKAKGYPVEKAALDNALTYLRDIEHRFPAYYGPEIRRSITSYALYTRMLAGDRDIPRAQGLIREAGGADKLAAESMESVGWLLGVMAGQASAAADRKALVRQVENHAVETAGAANFTTSYSDGGYLLLASDRRTDGVILESLIAEQKTSDLIPKVVLGLLAHRKAGRWDNTQDNVFVLQALDLYFHEYEKATPDFVAKVWLGDGYAGEHAFKGRTTDRFQIGIPMKTVAEKAATKPADLVIQKDGAGRLYYRIGMTYAPADLKLPAADYGFVVTRRYEPVDDPKDVVRQPDGSWKIKAGARVRVRLAMVAENRRYHVALVDPLPAGLEPMNPALAVTGSIPQDPSAPKEPYWWWTRTWYEHQNLRDERVEAFTSLLWEGVHDYTYVARATTPGVYVVPPAKAEEMYMPETFGRSASDLVVVE